MGGRGSKNQREVRSREQRGKERRRGRKRERGGTGKGKEKKGKIIRFIKDHEVFRKYTEASIRSDWKRKEKKHSKLRNRPSHAKLPQYSGNVVMS